MTCTISNPSSSLVSPFSPSTPPSSATISPSPLVPSSPRRRGSATYPYAARRHRPPDPSSRASVARSTPTASKSTPHSANAFLANVGAHRGHFPSSYESAARNRARPPSVPNPSAVANRASAAFTSPRSRSALSTSRAPAAFATAPFAARATRRENRRNRRRSTSYSLAMRAP